MAQINTITAPEGKWLNRGDVWVKTISSYGDTSAWVIKTQEDKDKWDAEHPQDEPFLPGGGTDNCKMKANIDGYYESMRVGTADNLTPRGDASEEIIMNRTAGGDNAIEAGDALIKAIKGYSLVSNNRYRSYASESNGYIIRAEHDGVYISGESTNMAYIQLSNIVALKKDHRYLSIIVGEGELIGLFNDGSQQFISGNAVYTCAADEKSYYQLRVNAAGVRLDTRVKIMLIDLTQMFGSGNEPATAEEFAHRLGYDSIEQMPYLPYNKGEIVSCKAEGVRTTDAEGDSSERSWGTTLHKYFPEGMKSAGTAYDEITSNKSVKRIGSVDLGTLNWEKSWWTDSNKPSHRIYALLPGKAIGVKNLITPMYSVNQKGDGLMSDKEICGNRHNSYIYIRDTQFPLSEAGVDEFITSLKGVMLYYELATPEEYTYDDLNLSMRVSTGGKEEAIISEGVMSAPLRMDVVYSIDAYATVVGNKQHIGNLSSLQTSTKTDLVSAVNEINDKITLVNIKPNIIWTHNRRVETNTQTDSKIIHASDSFSVSNYIIIEKDAKAIAFGIQGYKNANTYPLNFYDSMKKWISCSEDIKGDYVFTDIIPENAVYVVISQYITPDYPLDKVSIYFLKK